MELGMLMMPLHRPERPFLTVLREDQEAIVLADELGFAEVYVGEHYSNKPEQITSPFIFLATLIERTKRIKFGTGVINLPAAAPGDRRRPCRDVRPARPRPLHLRHRARRLARRLRDVQAEQPARPAPDDAGVDRDDPEDLGAGAALRVPRAATGILGSRTPTAAISASASWPGPTRPPHPPIAVSIMSPRSGSARTAGSNGWIPISANFTPACHVKTHWEAYAEGCEAVGREPEPAIWRARSQHPRDRERRRGRGLSGGAFI